ncbi:hypothetical protein GmHk_14G040490 [Glycine max]|nr:hypothetical protein GmHk_14G040490 [Glycine max]
MLVRRVFHVQIIDFRKHDQTMKRFCQAKDVFKYPKTNSNPRVGKGLEKQSCLRDRTCTASCLICNEILEYSHVAWCSICVGVGISQVRPGFERPEPSLR